MARENPVYPCTRHPGFNIFIMDTIVFKFNATTRNKDNKIYQ